MGKERDGSNSASCFVYALVCARAPESEGAVGEGRERDCDMKGRQAERLGRPRTLTSLTRRGMSPGNK